MLCRLVDDYLFVTTEESKARKFLDMMNAGQPHSSNGIMWALNRLPVRAIGHPEYGCFISAEKTLTNFDTDEHVINRTLPGQKGGHASRCSMYIIDMQSKLQCSLGAAF